MTEIHPVRALNVPNTPEGTPYVDYGDDGYLLVAQELDVQRGYMLGPDGTEVLLSPKHKPGYQYRYGCRKSSYAG